MSRRLGYLLILTLLGCGGSTTAPPNGDVTLEVMVARVSGEATVRAEVKNDQTEAIRHGVGCSFWGPGMQLFFLDALGTKLLLGDNRALPLCPDGIALLQSGGRIDESLRLEGTLHTEAGQPVPMQPGKYTAVVSFGWGSVKDPNAPWQTIEKRVVFRWPVLR